MRASITVLILCFLNCVSAANAEDQRFKGAVDGTEAAASVLKVKTSDGKLTSFDVIKKAKITVDGQPATLRDIRRGQNVEFVFKSDLEVVTEIVASGDGLPDPEISVLKELPNPASLQGSPWVSEDGLTLYWKSPAPGEGPWIWTGRRKTPDDLFSDFQKLVPGNDPTVTADGLELILLDQGTLLSSTRPNLKATFRRPQKIAEFGKLGFIAAPCISGDGLTLFAEKIDVQKGTIEVSKFQRSSRKSKWGSPKAVTFSGIPDSTLRFLQVSPDQKRAFASFKDSTDEKQENLLVMWSAGDKDTFVDPRRIVIGGEAVRGKFPRYIAATGELFFSRWRLNPPGPDELVVVRNFDPEAHSEPLDPAQAQSSP